VDFTIFRNVSQLHITYSQSYIMWNTHWGALTHSTRFL